MNIHVTGAQGLLGVEVMSALRELGTVRGSDIGEMDIRQPERIQTAFAEEVPEVVVHLAALKGNAPSRERPVDFLNVNTVGTVNLLEACRAFGVRRFIFMSSLTVHGPSDLPVDETSPWAPLHPYAASKAAAELMVQAYTKAYELQAAIFRPNFIVGPIHPPTLYSDNIIYDFIQAIERTGVIELAGDGSFQREWVYPSDVASAVAMAVRTPQEGCEAYILSANCVTMRELAACVIRRVGKGTIRMNSQRGGFSLISNSGKARQRLGWAAQIDLEGIVGAIWQEYQARQAGRTSTVSVAEGAVQAEGS